MPRKIKNRAVWEVSTQIQENSGLPKQTLFQKVLKIGHFFIFFGFGTFISILAGKEFWACAVVDVLMVAGGTQAAQIFIDGRTPLYSDFIVDTAGGMVGICIGLATHFAFVIGFGKKEPLLGS